ncbi:MAG: hypothetical protein Rhirs2KO_26600 [Rhizobiaceae bacterium]
MDSWDRHANWERDALERIAALLFALAGLAEMAGALGPRRRLYVLGLLTRGEAVARAFLMAPDTLVRQVAPATEDVPDPVDVPAGDALLLAVRFRALALTLVALLAQAAQSQRPGAMAGGLEPARQACPASPAPDTS